MNVDPLLKNVNSRTFLEDYLTTCGVNNVEAYLHPEPSNCDSCWDYPNMKEAVRALNEAIEDGKKIGVIVD